MDDDRVYVVECSKRRSHSQRLNASELQSLIDGGEFDCPEPKCHGALELTDSLFLICHVCQDVFEVRSLEEAQDQMNLGCQACDGRGFLGNSIHIRDSFQERGAIYNWVRHEQPTAEIEIADRSDYWEGLVHFCRLDEFTSIYRDRVIRASATGYFKVPSVCLTEATRGNWESLQKVHGRFGYAFRKRTILKAGGAPVAYLPPNILTSQKRIGIAAEFKPFINLIRTRANTPGSKPWDFLHEREWRCPTDIEFADFRPLAVIVDWAAVVPNSEDWQAVFDAAQEFKEFDLGTR